MPKKKKLTFSDVQEALRKRQPQWGGEDPGLEFRLIELGGETGECLEVGKKYLRTLKKMKGGIKKGEAMRRFGEEISDVILSAALLANQLNLDLDAWVKQKFNETSKKHGLKQKI